MAAASKGTMTALIGFERSQLEDLIEATEDVCIANDNSNTQVVISGLHEAVATLSKELICKRAIPLPVSGAFHSPFMAEASKSFSEILETVNFRDAQIPVLSNTNPFPSRDGLALKQRLKKQMTAGVRWRETMNMMIEQGIDTVVEIGPGKVLSSIAKKSMEGITTAQIASAEDLGE